VKTSNINQYYLLLLGSLIPDVVGCTQLCKQRSCHEQHCASVLLAADCCNQVCKWPVQLFNGKIAAVLWQTHSEHKLTAKLAATLTLASRVSRVSGGSLFKPWLLLRFET
jgi:hypothetical protein